MNREKGYKTIYRGGQLVKINMSKDKNILLFPSIPPIPLKQQKMYMK